MMIDQIREHCGKHYFNEALIYEYKWCTKVQEPFDVEWVDRKGCWWIQNYDRYGYPRGKPYPSSIKYIDVDLSK